jgi:hypothetical protein
MSNRKIPLLFAFLVAGAVACGLTVARAASAAAEARACAESAHDEAAAALSADARAPEENEVVHRAMEGLKGNLKKLRGALEAGGKQAEALAAVASMQKHALEAKAGGPSNLAEKPEAERAAHALAYRREIAVLLGELAALEVEVIDGQDQAALARAKDRLITLRDGAHERFQKQ